MKKLILSLVCASTLTSCYTSRLLVGDVSRTEPVVEVSKEHNAHFIFGLAKTGKSFTTDHIGEAPNFVVTTKYGFGDMMLSMLTAGIYTPTTTKYYIPLKELNSFKSMQISKQVRKPYHKDKGWEFGFTMETMFPFSKEKNGMRDYYGGNISIGRRFNPHFLLGLQLGGVYTADGNDYNHDLPKEKQVGSKAFVGISAGLFARYMLLNRKTTPYIEVNTVYYHDIRFYACPIMLTSTPSLGYQVRMGKNSYYNISVGYNLSVKKYEYSKTDAIAVKTGFSFVF